MAELVPIGTILAVISSQVIKTAQAANDVVFEKESFKVLGNYLSDLEPVLKELQLQKLNDSPAARQALESIEADLQKANDLVEKYKNRARFYLLVKCRSIVKEVQEVTRDIGKSLAALSLVNMEVLSGISEEVTRLQNEMQRANFEASQSRLQIVNKLNQGLSDQIHDQEFANNILKEIARAAGVPVEPAEITKELDNFKKEKEEAAYRKERAEVLFLNQVIELLSRADAARNYEEVKSQYFERVSIIEGYDPREEYIQPFKAFICCITGIIMVDPVSLCTGTACERASIQAWFDSGEKTDPETGEELQDLSFRPNLQLRQLIQEWKELNYCIIIRACKGKFLSGVDASIEEALAQMQELMKANSINKEWVTIGGLTEIVISKLGMLHSRYLLDKVMITLKDVVDGHARNKDIFVENQGFENVVACFGKNYATSTAAIELIYEVLHDQSSWNLPYCQKLSQQSNSISLLVSFLKNQASPSAEKAEEILAKLCDEEEENIVKAAREGWYGPLINTLHHGSASSRMSIVRAILGLEIRDEDMKLLGEKGVILPLLEMTSGNIESKELSLSALVKLSSFYDNKMLIAAAGGVAIVLKLMISSHVRSIIIAKCCEVLANLSGNGDGVKFLIDETGNQLVLEPVIAYLLAFQQNFTFSSDIVRRHALRALLGICQSQAGLVKSAVLSAGGVSAVLPLLDDPNQEIREAAINLLFLFSQHEPEGVVEYLLKPRRLEALVGFLENDSKGDVQMAAAGLLANLPKSETSLREKLIELGGLKAIINILKSGTMEAKENALSAFFRFTDPTNLESQRNVVELGAYPILVNFLKADSITAQARAAALLTDLSMRSHELSALSRKASCFCIGRARAPICPAHGGSCSVSKTFCLLEVNALPDLVKLLKEKIHATSYEAIQTLSTLVCEESAHRGANVLHKEDAISPIIEVLNWGSESLKGEALGVLEKVFMSREMVDLYGLTAKLHLARLTGGRIHEDGHLQRKAARVLLLIERQPRSSRSLIAGISG
ncbi:U-box domain-containing protein 43-like [Solanum pennellii]|uniref:RING-type E3 ubiquitin transferase n=1 Tax=Solanum pennellii TaxID=28526 RepID=A0ABM1VHP8_SOLPN|nr:U-box domain-containing protein 43-like [Solanum pennellii]XP_027775266.1 U-box domain-containing protein 43-like [Solanum pennellii]